MYSFWDNAFESLVATWFLVSCLCPLLISSLYRTNRAYKILHSLNVIFFGNFGINFEFCLLKCYVSVHLLPRCDLRFFQTKSSALSASAVLTTACWCCGKAGLSSSCQSVNWKQISIFSQLAFWWLGYNYFHPRCGLAMASASSFQRKAKARVPAIPGVR